MTHEEFKLVINYMIQEGLLSFVGPLHIPSNTNQVFDEGDANADITPSNGQLTSNLILANADKTAKDNQIAADATNKANYKSNASTNKGTITSDLAVLGGSPTLSQVAEILERALTREQAAIDTLSAAIR